MRVPWNCLLIFFYFTNDWIFTARFGVQHTSTIVNSKHKLIPLTTFRWYLCSQLTESPPTELLLANFDSLCNCWLAKMLSFSAERCQGWLEREIDNFRFIIKVVKHNKVEDEDEMKDMKGGWWKGSACCDEKSSVNMEIYCLWHFLLSSSFACQCSLPFLKQRKD